MRDQARRLSEVISVFKVEGQAALHQRLHHEPAPPAAAATHAASAPAPKVRSAVIGHSHAPARQLGKPASEGKADPDKDWGLF
ncbi:hypothetical protein ACQV5M_20915, partial [Leptospira sp. SA-E8]|uniref:hypothetical protein n=1 Tax=Leptospira sp. SA-E8 TaxID=3422259 RepID=UPI003EBEBF10